ncbi:MAG: hypothetical protein WCZ23_04705 [Rhodospirillaceae bacterium]
MRTLAIGANAAVVFLGLYLYLYDGAFYGGTAPHMAAAFFALPLLNIFALFR